MTAALPAPDDRAVMQAARLAGYREQERAIAEARPVPDETVRRFG